MKKTKFNPELLAEELKKFKLLSEYTFITGDDKKPLILGDENLDEADEPPTDLKPEDSAEKVADKLGLDDENKNNDASQSQDSNANLGSDFGGEEKDATTDGGEDMGSEPTEEPMAEPMEEPASDEVEVDVTSLVQGSEEAKESAEKANRNSEMLLQKLSDLESRLAKMTAISDKIEGLEKEIIKRNPTPVEKLEMRSLDSYPFNQKLSDYWSTKEGAYDVMDEKPEYVLTKDDVNNSFSDSSIKRSFNINESLYDEENINDFDEEDI